MDDLYVVIVSYNTRELLSQCLASVYDSRGAFTYGVCVVDNGSTDGSAEMVRKQYPQADLIASDVNVGYASANNLGLRNAGARFYLLLNPDTVLPPSALADMLAFMNAHGDAGVSGPRLVLDDGSLDLACRRSFPTPEVSLYRLTGLSRLFPKSKRFGRYNLTYLDPGMTTEVDSVVGAFMLIRAEALQEVGLLDESFFMYGEDLDLAYRIKAAGWRVWYNAEVTVLHYKRAASRHSLKAQVEFYRAMHLGMKKHYGANSPRLFRALMSASILILGSVAVARYWISEKAERQRSEGGR
jgi:N-acetylglucosaminyl-diphospho-decaprenol L-rhamnosyltransferase